MKLKTASVDDLFGSFDHTVTLKDEGLTYIHSPNGYGKSTFARMISYALKGDVDELSEIPFKRMDLGFDDDSNLIIEKYNDEIFLQMSRNELESEITADEMGSLMDVTFIPSERLIVRKMDGRLVPALESYANDLSERLMDAQEDDVLRKVPSKYTSLGDDELIFRAKDMKAKLDFMKDAGFEPDIPAGMRFPPSRFDVNGERKEYAELVDSMDDYIQRNYSLAESVVVYKDILNGLFIGKDVYINEQGMIGVQFTNGTDLPISKLSSGEKQVMVIFYRLLFQTNPGSLVIIDEPEISLHVSWQQRIGNIMIDIARLRNLQILAATHSPQIVHDKWDLAEELRADRA